MKTDNWEKVKEIFGDALKLAPDDRLPFLDRVCAGDPDMRGEVESLLSSLDTAESFMETPAVEKKVSKDVPEESHKLENGTRFGHYEIIKLLGVGGMGEVYLAKDTKLDRRVAIKILNEKIAKHESNLRRFTQEAKAASGLNHPNILVIHEIGAEGSAHYIVSEYIEGQTLREIIKESRLKLAEILDISIQIAGALAAAHAARIIHRDIKPENIMIRPDGYVKILDFGLAKLVEQNGADFGETVAKQNETAKGVILGTVSYMSPEQAKGERVDERTDIFSLGTVIYEMITGKTPFHGTSLWETLANLINSEPELSALGVTDAPDALQQIISKMLRKSPDERYSKMEDLPADLKAVRRDLEFQDKPERASTPNHRGNSTSLDTPLATSGTESVFSKITKPAFVAGFVILLLASIGLSYWFFVNRSSNQIENLNPKPIESIAVMPFVNESGSADVEYLSDGMTERLISSLSQLANLNVKTRSSVFRYKGKDITPREIGKELNVQAVLNGRFAQRGQDLSLYVELVDVASDGVVWSRQYNRKQAELIALQSEITRDVSNKLKTKLSGADEQQLAKSYTTDSEAYQLYLKGRFHWSKFTDESLRRSIDYYNQAINRDPNFALAYAGLADAYLSLGSEFAPPSEVMPQAKVYALKALELDENLPEAKSSLGLVKLLWDWDWTEANRLLHSELENYKAIDTFSCSLHYANTIGRNDEAIPGIEHLLERDPLSPVVKTELGCAYYYGHKPEQAIEEFRNALELDPNYLLAYFGLGRAYEQLGRFDEAINELKKGRATGNNWPTVVAELAYCYSASDKKSEARKVLRELQEQSKRRYVDPYLFALVYTGLDEKDQAFSWLEKAYNVRSSYLPWLNVEPQFGSLHHDPRYAGLLKRIGVVSQEQ